MSLRPQWSIFHFGNNPFSHKTDRITNIWMYNPFFFTHNPPFKVKEQRSKPAVDQSNPEPEVCSHLCIQLEWNIITRSPFILIRCTSVSFIHYLYATDLHSGHSHHFSLHKERSTWANVGKAGNYRACLKWCSKGPLCLTQFVFCFLFFWWGGGCSLFKTQKEWNNTGRKERTNKEQSTKCTLQTACSSCWHFIIIKMQKYQQSQHTQEKTRGKKMAKRGLSELSWMGHVCSIQVWARKELQPGQPTQYVAM